MIVLTGAAGFIGSCLLARLNALAYTDIVLVDDFSVENKKANYINKQYSQLVDREHFFDWLEVNAQQVQIILHIGARTDTTEFDQAVFDHLNLNYTKKIWEICCVKAIPLIYASSAATYGDGALGYRDDHHLSPQLQPLNPYGKSKNDFDVWALQQEKKPFFWAGLKFFNVYGPNEYHKGRMASVIFHAHRQIKENGQVKLFRSHRPDFKDGQQLRDFIYVKDLVEVIVYLMENRPKSGLYNLGTGKARSFYDLASAVFKAMNLKENIAYIDIPQDIRDKYQYYTEAKMDKLVEVGYSMKMNDLEEGIADYLKHYLMPGKYW